MQDIKKGNLYCHYADANVERVALLLVRVTAIKENMELFSKKKENVDEANHLLDFYSCFNCVLKVGYFYGVFFAFFELFDNIFL